MPRKTCSLALAALSLTLCSRSLPAAEPREPDRVVDGEMDSLLSAYRRLHQSPELSAQEKETSAFLASELRGLGYEVTDHFGKYDRPELTAYGVVAVLRNGEGPVLMLRADMDALPVAEATGLPYASHVKAKRADGTETGVMHACGHDIHIAVLLGVARALASLKDRWGGTLVLVGQPAEEAVGGAQALLRGGLYSRFPKPDYALALHDSPALPAGKVSWREGAMLAGSDDVDITVRGAGGHGAMPHLTKDPVVIASELVVALQTVVSRELDPLSPAVVTVGTFHAGTKRNVIPDEARLQLTVRTMSPSQREKALSAIARIAKGVAAAAGVPPERAPVVKMDEEPLPATINDPALARRVGAALERSLGKENVLAAEPIMASEDFSLYALEEPHPPICMFWLGAADPGKLKDAAAKGVQLPGLHSSEYAPAAEPTIRTGVRAMLGAALDLLAKEKPLQAGR